MNTRYYAYADKQPGEEGELVGPETDSYEVARAWAINMKNEGYTAYIFDGNKMIDREIWGKVE
jgi:hypothetical protein